MKQFCQTCHKLFEANRSDVKRCQKCAREHQNVQAKRTRERRKAAPRMAQCRECGASIEVVNYRLYCAACAKKRRAEANTHHRLKPTPEGFTPCDQCLLRQSCSLLIVGHGKPGDLEERWAFSDDPPSSAQHQVWLEHQAALDNLAVSYEPALQIA